MSVEFSIYDVSAEFLMDITKVVASSPHPLSKNDLYRSFDKSQSYISRTISQCLQLNLLEIRDDRYVCSARYRDLIKRSDKTQLHMTLRQALQRYPPFLLYLDFLSKGYSAQESARMTMGIFRIQSSMKAIEKAFRNWGLQTYVMKIDVSGNLIIPEGEQGLPSEYVANLMKALKAELQASIFLIETMSPPAYAYITTKEINLDDLSSALINYESDSKTSANKACQMFEHFLFKLGEDVGVNTSRCNGIIELVDMIRASNRSVVLRNQSHICHGIGGLRNMAHHDPDKETGKSWIFTPQGAIISSLIVPTMIRSLFLHWKEKKQEF